jgi:hypothetical protein
MNYTTKIDINLPIDRAIELFDNADNLSKWQPELLSFKHLSGEPGQEGAKSRLLYQMGKREIEMIETITKNDLPREFSGTYETRGAKNWISNRFSRIDDNQTKWIADNEFIFSGIMSIMSIFMRSAFPKQTLKYMQQFKEFTENE